MTLDRSWQFIGSTGGVWYRFYDWLRRGVNGRLVSFLRPFASGDRRTIRLLEAGSGTAFASSLFASETPAGSCVCLDLDIEALRIARENDARLLPVVGDLTQMPFVDDAFDLVFNSSTVEHLEEPAAAVREMQRVSRLRGTVFVGVPYAYGPLWFQPIIRSSRIGVWLGTVFSRRQLEEMLRSAGLVPRRTMRYFARFFVGIAAEKVETPSIDRSATA